MSSLRTAALVLTVVLGLSGCGAFGDLTGNDKDDPTPSASATPTFNSQFTRDGTYQSHIKVDGMDFVYTIWPTKSTPRTNLWFPKGNKFFSFTLTSYDLDRGVRDKFATKRMVYLDRITATSRTTTASGNTQHPYRLNAAAKKITFDPEPVSEDGLGMLITSPKGAFELRNQKIGSLADDTIGMQLNFTATVHIQREAGSTKFDTRKIRQVVPIAIFESDTPTKVTKIPFDAN